MARSLLRVPADRVPRPTVRLVPLLVWAVLLVLMPIGLASGDSRPRPSGALVRLSAPAAAHGGARLALLAEVHRELATMTDSGYQHKTDVDDGEGGFYFDCSGFVDYALAHSLPADLKALPVTTSTRPLAKDFEHHFRAAADGSGDSAAAGPWREVPTVAELRPGDVIAWLKPADVKSRNTGHVLVVLQNPVRNAARPDEWLVKVADSTTSPHAQDSRGDDADGLGTGTIGLSVEGADGGGHPVGYYWRGGVSTVLKHTEISLGQPG
jgi:hypothetical protein